ncbi:hypothetical protein EAS64_12485 [Trebonia kvetii]|uniref:Uncharacterized protein n=1 Tax=Trebonia kvetii TaxID=2480626 RepID=A0A6P2C1X3_9ACTN|nr:hypothetical protein [Trebonia kvetii]TVZ05374.1 hypothetical protein EAS64_12485 [Trebonia kvetii]
MRALLPAVALAATLIVATAGCQSSSSATAGGTTTASAGSSASPSLSISASVSQPSLVPASPSDSPVSVPTAHQPTVYFAEGGDTNGTSMHASGCSAGCPLSGDGTTSLWNMTWPTWNPTVAIGTGTEKIDDCNPSCATGKLYPVKVTVTFRDAVLVCTSQHVARYYWTRASFAWPAGLPTALSGDNAPVNPVTYANITAESTPSCG